MSKLGGALALRVAPSSDHRILLRGSSGPVTLVACLSLS